MLSTVELIKHSMDSPILFQERNRHLHPNLGEYNFAREYRTVAVGLPRQSGKTSAIVSMFRPAIDMYVGINQGRRKMFLDRLEERAEKGPILSCIRSLLPRSPNIVTAEELNEFVSSERRQAFKTLHAKYMLRPMGLKETYNGTDWNRDCNLGHNDYQVIYFDEVNPASEEAHNFIEYLSHAFPVQRRVYCFVGTF